MKSNALGIDLGDFIDVASFDRVSVQAWTALPDQGHRQAFSVGWNGMAYRALGASLSVAPFRQLFADEPAAHALVRYQQDDFLFRFVTSASAAVDNAVYAAHVAALGFGGDAVSTTKLSDKRASMMKRISDVPQTARLADVIEAELDSPAWKSLALSRDVMLHRGRMPRNHFAGGNFDGQMTIAQNPKASPPDWQNTVVFDAKRLDSWVEWLPQFIEACTRELTAVLV
jgi:hypothetical protein